MRRILVGLKRVVDYNVRVRVAPDGSGVVTDGLKMSINPFDEIALEEALRLRERGIADEVVIVSVGEPACEQQLRTGLAMGADRALRVDCAEALEPLGIARVLHAIAVREQADLVLLGKQAIDSDDNQTGQMLAALWDRPQATFASCIAPAESPGWLKVTREVDAGLETLEIELPAVVTADLRLNVPRYVRLPEIVKAKRKPLDVEPLDAFGVDAARQLRTVTTAAPPSRPPGVRAESVDALVGMLRDKGLLS